VQFLAVATDDSGLTGQASAVMMLTPNQPPTVSISSSYNPVIAGYPEHFCATGSDDVQVASVELDLDASRFTSSAGQCAGTSCLFCADYVVPQQAFVAVGAVAYDSFGLGASATATIPVVANQPPVVSLDHRDYLVAGIQAYLAANVSDERPPLAWEEIDLNGTVLTHQSGAWTGTNGAWYTPASAGALHLTASAQDRAGAIGLATPEDVPVLPSGSGLACLTPVQLPMHGKMRIVEGPPNPAVSACGISSDPYGAWLSLPFDGPVCSVTVQATGGYYTPGVAIVDGCSAALPASCGSSADRSALSSGARVFVSGGSYWNDSYGTSVEITQATLGPGALCEPGSSTAQCLTGTCQQNAAGEYRCPDGPACPPGACGAPVAADLSSMPLPITVTGSTVGAANSMSSSCVSSFAPDRVYLWTAPASGTYQIDLQGSSYDTTLYAFDYGCAGAPLACNDDYYGLQSMIRVSPAAGEVLVIVVDGWGGSSGSFALHITQVN
jgi:hypothetical protein